MRAPGPLQKSEILHVARADLDHVGMAFDHVDGGLIQRFAHNLEPEGVSHFLQDFKGIFAQAGERIGRGARLEGAAPEEFCACLCHTLGYGERLVAALDRAGTGDDCE